MNYYQHHIGDFMRDTAHLSAVEDGIYRRALDWYYANEKPLPADIKLICRYLRARDKTEIAAVNIILSEFFVLTDEGYTQSRCDKEIALYNDKVKTNRVNGKKGGRPKKETQSNPTTNQQETQSVISGLNSETQIKGNQEPITINQEPIIKIHTQNAREDFSPNLEKLNDMLKRSGSKPIEQAHLEQALVTFNPHYEHYELTENQRYAKLVTWLKRDELKQNKPNARASPTKQRLDFDSVLEKKNQMRDVTPVRAIHHEP